MLLSHLRNYKYNSTIIDQRVKLNSSVDTNSLWLLHVSNLAMLIFSLGLAQPFTKFRSARFFAAHTSVTIVGGLDNFTDTEASRLQALGEEVNDIFDIELDVSI